MILAPAAIGKRVARIVALPSPNPGRTVGEVGADLVHRGVRLLDRPADQAVDDLGPIGVAAGAGPILRRVGVRHGKAPVPLCRIFIPLSRSEGTTRYGIRI